jgi:CheY-like chemotaxis protein
MTNNPTILVVEDDADIRELMSIALERSGFSVILAADGAEALDQLYKGPEPGLILLDLMMPRMDGEQFMKELRESRFRDTPVVILSGHVSAQKKANELQVEYCLMKPVEFGELLRTLKHFVRPRQQRDVA